MKRALSDRPQILMHLTPGRMNEEEERLRLEKELGVRELTPGEIQAMHNHSKEIENLVRENYPEYFASRSPGTPERSG